MNTGMQPQEHNLYLRLMLELSMVLNKAKVCLEAK